MISVSQQARSLAPATLNCFPAVGLCLVALTCGCSSSETPRPVKGTVKFADGSVPQGEVAMIRFDPVSSDKSSKQQPASGAIQPDGSYSLTTIHPDDGAIPGRYKVVLAIFKKHDRPESPVPAKYHRPGTTPLEATVEASGANVFDFTIDRQ